MEKLIEKKGGLLSEGAPKRPEETTPGGGGFRQPATGQETIVSPDTIFEGKALAKGELRIDGTFKGEIVSSSRVFVGAGGKLEATVEAKSMTISGRVVGNLRVLERLELLSTGELYGDMETQPGALIIEKGARLEGRCSMGLNAGKPASPHASSGGGSRPESSASPRPDAPKPPQS